MKKKLLIIIILVVVLAIAGVLAFLILTGRLFGKKEEGGSSVASSSLSVSGSGASSSLPASGSIASSMPNSTAGSGAASMPASSLPAPTAQNDPTKFFEGEFYFQNLTGAPLTEICLSPSGASAWEDNILGSTTLENGAIWSQPLMLRDVGGTWDLRATDANGKELNFTGLDFYTNTKFLLTLDGETAVLRQAA